MTVKELETPALVVDVEAMERNMSRVDQILSGTSMVLYPHYKSHKCPAIAKLQMARGAGGITCAKLSEAIDLCSAGITNIVIANQVVQDEKLPKLASLAKNCRLTVCVDHKDNILALEAAMAAQEAKLFVLVEFDVGMKRCGVESFEEFLSLAKLVEAQPHLCFEGIQAYAGHLSHEEDTEKRYNEIQKIEKTVADLKQYCQDNGISVKEVCGGSTGFGKDKPKSTVYTQAQFGSYLFMDRSFLPLQLDFEQALFVETTVVSAKVDRIVVDCGTKVMTMDQYPPYFLDFPDAQLSFSEEHTTIMVKNSGLKIGDRLRYIPGHCCTTINTFDKLAAVKGENVVAIWDITSRGKAQ